MNLRFVHLTAQPGRLPEFRDLYAARIVPALRGTPGCLSARLLQDTAEPESCLSMTTWSSESDAEAYAASGLYDRLLDETDDALVGEEKALPLSQRAPLQDPEVESLAVEAAHDGAGGSDETAFLRIVALRVEPGHEERFRERWRGVVAPGLLAAGCRQVLLAASGDRSQYLSLSFWTSEEEAVRYEASGRFDHLTAAIRDHLSGMYQWRLSFAPAGAKRKVEGRDLEVRSYRFLAGGPFR